MDTPIFQDLRDILHRYTAAKLEQSNPYTTVESVSWQVLRDCASALHLDLNRRVENSYIIDSSIMSKIDAKWENLQVKLSHEDTNTYKKIKSDHYVNTLDIQKFLSVLLSKKQENFVHEILAVDGFQGLRSSDMKHYIKNLEIHDQSTHIATLREFYQEQIPASTVYLTLLLVYSKHVKDDEIKNILENEITVMLPKAKNITQLISKYESQVCENDIQSLATEKLTQLMSRIKKTKRIHKRKRD